MTVISQDDHLTAGAWAACVRPRLYLYTVLIAGDKDALSPLGCFAFFRCIIPILHYAVIDQIFDVGFQVVLGSNRFKPERTW